MKQANHKLKLISYFSTEDAKNIAKILLAFAIASIILYGYFLFFSPYRLQLVYQNWDGPSYVVIAKSFYNKDIIPQVNTLRIPVKYFAAHPPFYPILIKLFSFIGYFQAMIVVSLMSTALFLCSFYYFLKDHVSAGNAFLLSLLSIFISPRWFVVSHVGSSEPLFLFLLCVLLMLIKKNKTVPILIVAMLLQLTRMQGILIFGGIFLYYLYQRVLKKISSRELIKRILPLMIMPVSLLILFLIYHIQLGDFLAFFRAQELANSTSHLQLPPYKVLLENHYLPSAIESWKEIYLVYYFLISYTLIKLFKEKQFLLGFVGLVYAIPLYFLVHVDLARYSIPLLPLFFVAFKNTLSSKYFLLATLITIPAIYLFAINNINLNLTP